nr:MULTISPECIES: serine hydrolase domain-containing protein [Kribbella]
MGGRPRVDVALGEAQPGVPMTRETIVEWASATKPITCAALAVLWERGALDIEDPVHHHLPEFAAAGKEQVTVKHLLTHTAGLTTSITKQAPAAELVADICASPLRPDWVPGQRCGYNSIAMWIVAELVTRLDGRPFDQFVREEIFEVAGLDDCWLAMPPETYERNTARIARIPGIARSGTAYWVTWGRPTGGIHGPISQLGRFYESLGCILSPDRLREMTSHHLTGVYDEVLGARLDRGLGFVLGSADPQNGDRASSGTYGHGGQTWSTAFADPARGLVAAVYWNGATTPAIHADRLLRLLNALYADLADLER